MVEIKLERKRKPIWPWLFLLLLLGLLAWGIYELASDRDDVEDEEPPATGMVIPAQGKFESVYFVSV
ncbi:hypothetical protein [Botryobacter ruber]|uniref:hypothetical protein n=1 Tax=Botryobacter ruber TaxID=2171629 RepID=UPI000E0CA4DE|nr:hypothetical protein [Botryobacter ruber]